MRKRPSNRLIRKLQKDSLGAGGTTTLNRNARKINVLRVFVFKEVMDSVTDFVKYTYYAPCMIDVITVM
jgi:hypothetical protein